MPPWGAIGILALLGCVKFSLIYYPLPDRTYPDRVKIKFTISKSNLLSAQEPFSKREIVEEALEPWLQENGYL